MLAQDAENQSVIQCEPGKLRIGQLADATDVGVETIRYYESEGILRQPDKPQRGARLYPSSYIGRIRFVKAAQSLGCSLAEVKVWLGTIDSSNGDSSDRLLALQRIFSEKLSDLQNVQRMISIKIEIVQSLRDAVQKIDGKSEQILENLLVFFRINPK